MRILSARILGCAVILAAISAAHADEAVKAPMRDAPNQQHRTTPADFPWSLRASNTALIPAQSMLMQPSGQDILPGSLHHVLRASLRHDATLQAAAQEATAAHHAVDSARFDLLPAVSLTAAGETSRSSSLSGLPQLDRTIATGSITAEWTLFASGGKLAAIEAAQASANAADYNYLAQERSLIFENATLYLDYVANTQRRGIIKRSLRRIRKIRTMTKRQYAAGFASRTDVALVDAEVASLQSQVEQATQQIGRLRIELLNKTGVEAGHAARFPAKDRLLPKSRNDAVARALQGNPFIESAIETARSVKAQSRVQRSNYLPKLTAYASLEQQSDDRFDFDTDADWKAGVRFSMPIGNLSQVARYRQVRAQAQAAGFRARQVERQIKTEIETAWEEMESLSRNRAILSRKISARKKSANGVRKELDAGLKPVSDLLREEMRLAEARIEHLQNRLSLSRSVLRIAVHMPDMTIEKLAGKS